MLPPKPFDELEGLDAFRFFFKRREMLFSLSPFAPEKLVPRDGFGRPVLRQLAHSLHAG